jgi:putative Holliday junction resolvase
MSRILGLDPGAKRIGVAVSDPTQTLAQSLGSVNRDRAGRWIEQIGKLVAEYQVSEVVVGLPRNMDGREGPAAERARRLVEKLTARLKIPVAVWDERLTTVAAQRMFREVGVKARRAKRHLDGVAAVLILQGYLDRCARRRDEGRGDMTPDQGAGDT